MFNKPQAQDVAEGAVALQAGGAITVNNNGLSYSDVREVALDVFRANFYQLAGIAAETATERAKDITEAFLAKLEKENPAGLAKANDPDFQYALYTAQKAHARIGDKDLEALLVDLLVDRSKQHDRDILQIVLNESLNTAPKLTDGQLSSLALVFLFKYTQNINVGDHKMLGAYLDAHARPFIAKASRNQASFQHLEFTGCGSISMGHSSLESIIGTVYHGQFQKGFDESEVTARQIAIGKDDRFFMPCFNDYSKLQINANSKEILRKKFDKHSIEQADRERIEALFDLGKMGEAEIRDQCIQIRPYMKDLLELWSVSAMPTFTLTSVGIAIGHANIKRLIGEFAQLSIWIN